jgi:nucleoside phosphorylase
MRATKRYRGEGESAAIICGLAGSLDPDLHHGSVFIPDAVSDEHGRRYECDAGLVEAMRLGARDLGLPVSGGAILTASAIVTGAGRQAWLDQGFFGADMESAVIAHSFARVAVVRVILDSPSRPISAEWEHAARAVTKPRLWAELMWMAVHAPRYALRAAAVVERGLRLMAAEHVAGVAAIPREHP